MDKIKEKLKKLDNSFPLQQYNHDQLWNAIDNKINKRRKVRQFYLTYAAVAASLLILAIVLTKSMNTDMTYSQSEDMVFHSYEEAPEVEEAESEAIEFIKRSCVANLPVCKTPEFKELRKELDLLDKEINQLNEMINQYGEDELLIKSKIKIENHKSDVTRKLVQILIA
ncbi:hypothetical protein LVD17_16790 [Fulvivirga ulvae]|uniref:hypothetical protein n=1 Tax=Fulvivirga ulvae TaxID=2904245 RepID=UPI001F191F62|nr:hypothetical protein [Fulvivirga ulvae]UII29956.1 hypothetical protein LVD17_16790 [Fulvivirga ulvae]